MDLKEYILNAKPKRFKNVAHERGYEIALVLLDKKPCFTHTQRMRGTTLTTNGKIIMTTSDCVDVIMFDIDPDIALKYNVSDPDKSARDAMGYVPSFFPEGIVKFDYYTKPRKLWFLEIRF
jgi:hypothetical protein